MTIIWLIVWLIHATPALHPWNNWLVALCICAGIDVVLGGGIFGSRR